MAETKRTAKAAVPAAAKEVKAAPVKETVKAAATEAPKAETKTSAVPVMKEETKAAPAPAIKAEAPAAAPAKKAPAKRTAKKEAPVKRAATKRAAEPKTTVFFEFDGKQIIAKDVMDRAIKDFKSTHKDVEIKDFELYIVADEGAAYYVVNGEPSDDYKVML